MGGVERILLQQRKSSGGTAKTGNKRGDTDDENNFRTLSKTRSNLTDSTVLL